MKKIFHVAETIKGGVATIIRQLTVNAEEYDIHCLVPDTQVAEIKESNAKLHTFTRSGRNMSSFASLAKRFVSIYLKERPEIVHIHSSFAGFICRGVLFFLPGSPKVIYCPHAFSFLMDTSETKKKLYAIIEKILSIKTDKILCVSHYEYNEAVKWGMDKNKLTVIYNGVEPPEDIVTAEKNDDGILNVLFVGRLDYQKGFDIVEKVAEKLEGKCRIVVVGGGVHSNPTLNESEHIHYAGWVTKKDMAKYYADADVLLMPSRWESFGLVAVEAQSYGLPVVASRCSSIPEVLKEGVTGFLFDVGDVDEICRILQIHSKKDFGKMKADAISFYGENFTSQKMVEKTFDLYRDIMS